MRYVTALCWSICVMLSGPVLALSAVDSHDTPETLSSPNITDDALVLTQPRYLIDRTYRGNNREKQKLSFSLSYNSTAQQFNYGAWLTKTISDHVSGMIGYRAYANPDIQNGIDVGIEILHYYDPVSTVTIKGRYELFYTNIRNQEELLAAVPTWMLSKQTGNLVLFAGATTAGVLQDTSTTYDGFLGNSLFAGAEWLVNKTFSILVYAEDNEVGIGLGKGLPVQLGYNFNEKETKLRFYHPYWRLH